MIINVIRLQTHDDVISVCDEMNRGQAQRALLVGPERSPALSRRLDLVLIQRHSRKLGIQIALVSKDSDIRFYAAQIGIPFFSNERAAQTQPWRVERRKRLARLRRKRSPATNLALQPAALALHRQPVPKTPLSPVLRWLAFGLSLLSILAIAAALLPSAAIQVKIPQQSQQINLQVSAGSEIEQVNLAGELPTHRLQVVVEGRDSLPASGKVQAPAAPAAGAVLFTNLTDQVVEIPLGAILSPLSSPNPTAGSAETNLRFATTRAGRVPAGAGKTLSLPVQALQPGAAGNLKANQLQAIQGRLGLRLSATNPAPLKGGQDLPVAGPTDRDRQALHNQLLQQLQQSALAEIQTLANQSDLQLPALVITPTLRLNQILSQVYEPDENIPAETLQLTLRLEFEAQVVTGSDLRRLLTPILDAALPAGYQSQPLSLILTNQGLRYELASGRSRWRLSASRSIQPTLTPQTIAQLGRALPRAAAAKHLQQRLELAAPPQIQVWPAWWPYLPLLPSRIQVTLLNPSTTP